MMFFRKLICFLLPSKAILKTKLDNGAYIFGRNKRGYGGRGIFVYGENIEAEFKNFELFLKDTEVFVDIGANTGIYSLKAAKFFEAKNKGTVLSIEPNTEIASMLQYSVRRNNFENVRVRNLGAGGKTEERTLWMNHDRPHAFSIVNKIDNAFGISTLTVSLDDLLTWEGIKRLDYLKIDVEGAEDEVIKGAKSTIKEFRPIIQTEGDVQVDYLESYKAFHAPNSDNVLYIPSESNKVNVPLDLGWDEVEITKNKVVE